MPYTGEATNARRVVNTFTASTVQQQTNDQQNDYFEGMIVVVNVTAASGTGGITPRLLLKVPGGGVFVQLNEDLITPITTTGTWVFFFFPGAQMGHTHAQVLQALSIRLPFIWAIQFGVGDASAYTYSVSVYEMIQ